MLKLLRNLVLAAILLAGAVKLLAGYAVGNDAARIVQALAPIAQIKYDGLSAGLDGSVTVTQPSVTQGADHRVYRADSVTFETPGLFWLLKHSLLHENDLPPTLRVSARHLQMPPIAWIDPELFDATTLVPFAAAGCGATTLVGADYKHMGLSDAVMDAQLDYRYQPETHALAITVQASTGGFSAASVHGDLHPFDIGTLTSLPMWQKMHAGQLSVNFTDQGFLHRRNQFCAQKTGVAIDEFVNRHLAAVQTLLADHHVEPSNEVLSLYRNLVARGGEVSALSLPRTTFVLADWRNGAPDDTLRQLNITTRYRDTPPVMLRLVFTQPAQAPADETAQAEAPAPAPAPPVQPAPVGVAKPPPSPPPVAVAVPTISEPPKLPAPAKPSDNMGLHDLDRVEAKLAPKPAPPKPAPEPAKPAASTGDDSQYASEPPPPPNSTLALAWKPGIERLPPKTPGKREYEVIDYANLGGVVGQRVRLITEGDKRIEGYLISADPSAVRLRVGRADGDAQFEVPKKRIQQIQLVRRTPLS